MQKWTPNVLSHIKNARISLHTAGLFAEIFLPFLNHGPLHLILTFHPVFHHLFDSYASIGIPALVVILTLSIASGKDGIDSFVSER